MLPRCFWQEVPLFDVAMNCGSLSVLQEIRRVPLLLLEFSGVRRAALTWEGALAICVAAAFPH